ncbi:hypothetical protein GGR57DRAFT_507895 [Xylariaceae sp. FL1272]|nr:hypothetical protein GGR57DRAFT_507895 [Xylariaceae sp. FL1272]
MWNPNTTTIMVDHDGFVKMKEPEASPNPEGGPLKKAIAGHDSLYKFISWDDPARTIAAYVSLLGLLCGVHYLHPTQMILKVCATWLGFITLATLISRGTKNDFMAHAQPRAYKKFPEPTLNATLKDVHDFAQYCIVQIQKTFYGGDLKKTTGAFAATTGLFWLIKIASPFSLTMLGLHALFIAPLIISPEGRDIALHATEKAQYLADQTAQTAKRSADATLHNVGDMVSGAQHTAESLASSAKETTEHLASSTKETAGNLASGTKETAGNLASSTRDTAGNLASGASDRAKDLGTGVQDTVGTLTSGTKRDRPNDRNYTSNSASSAKDTLDNASSQAQAGGSKAANQARRPVGDNNHAGRNSKEKSENNPFRA